MILIIDDQMPVAGIMARYLERAGYMVAIAYNRNDALRQLPTLPHLQLVILDVHVPHFDDGMAILAAVQQHLPRLPVLLLTGATSVIPGVGGVPSIPILYKPLPMYALVAAVQRMLAAPALEAAHAYPTH